MDTIELTEELLKVLNSNYHDIYALDITYDKVYNFEFDSDNTLIIKDIISFMDFIESIKNSIHEDDVNGYFNAISLSNLDRELKNGNTETKVKYRKKNQLDGYHYYMNIINYLDFNNRKIIYMMSEDINERVIKSEISVNRLQEELESMKNNSKVKVNTNNDNLSVLIIDDSTIIRSSLKKIFSSIYGIVEAKDGLEAIDYINKNIINKNRHNIGLILLDLMMPNSDGFQVLNYLKKNNLFDKIPVVIVSGDEDANTRRKVYEYDIVDMINKPFDVIGIRKRICKIVDLYQTNNKLENESNEDMLEIINNLIKNYINNENTLRLKKISKIYLNALKKEFDIDDKFIKAFIECIPFYNIGSLALSSDLKLNANTIKKFINYGFNIVDYYILDEYEKAMAKNIIRDSFETYNGKGLPNRLKGDQISLEGQIANVVLSLYNSNKTMLQTIKLMKEEIDNYNPKLIKILDSVKNDLKVI